jgi:galactokinase
MIAVMEQFFVPGRLCLFGEHSDWAAAYRTHDPTIAAGWCLVAGTDQGLSVAARRGDRYVEIESVLPTRDRHVVELRAESGALDRAARSPHFFRYVAGAAAEMHARYGVGGLSLQLRSDLPVQKGLSSSAAVCVATVRAFARAYGLELDAAQEMEIAYAGERRTGSECGRMDQVVAHGRNLTALCFDGDGVEVERFRSGGALRLLVVDLRRGKDTRRILRDLNRCYPDAASERAHRVRAALGPRNRELHHRARAALEAGDAAELGACMLEAQRRFDVDVAPASPALDAPRLREVLAHPAVAELGHGGKGVGSQGDGCAQIVTRGEGERKRLALRLQRDLGVGTLPLTLGA